MNMVQSRHKRVFVSPPSRDYSHPATASQSGSKWPKGSRPKKKKKHPNLCSTMVHANHSPHSLPPTLGAHPLLVHPSKPEFLLRAVWSLFTEVSVKSAELHTFHMFIRGDKERISEKYMNRTNDWLGMDEEDFFFFFITEAEPVSRYLRNGNSFRGDSAVLDLIPHTWLMLDS